MADLKEVIMQALQSKQNDIERHLFLVCLSINNPNLFFELMQHAPMKLVPLVYTPTIGAVCTSYNHLFPFGQRGKGDFICRCENL
jgi:malic enzyme